MKTPDILELKETVMYATSIYLRYIEQYSSIWNANNKKISEETFGKLVIFSHQLKEIESHTYMDDEEKAIINDCLLEIENFANYIIKTLTPFI